MDQISVLLVPADFYGGAHGRIYQAMLDLHHRGEPADQVMVTALLKEQGKLDEVGGAVFLTGLSEQVPFATNVRYYAKLVLEKAIKRSLATLGQQLPLDGSVEELLTFTEGQINDLFRRYHSLNGGNPLSSGVIDSSQFASLDFPEKKIIIEPFLQESQMNMIVGPRGIGKTQLGISMCGSASSGNPLGPWKVVTPVPSLFLDGEMAHQDTQDRLKQLIKEKPQQPIYIYCDSYMNQLGLPRANLLNPEWRDRMKEILLARKVKLWVVDNLASLCPGVDQCSQAEWSPINEFFLDLRFAGINTTFLHHTNRAGGQRGTGAREDNLDLIIMLERPANYATEDGTRFTWRFEKARVPHESLAFMGDIEFRLEPAQDGSYIWTYRNVRANTKIEVLRRIGEGVTPREVAKELGITEARVSQLKREMVKEGFLTKEGRLTQEGFKKLNF